MTQASLRITSPANSGGYVTEQVLVVNVRGFGLVLISRCGHPRIEQILAVTEQVLDAPIRVVVGGLHLPVHAAGTPAGAAGGPGQPASALAADQRAGRRARASRAHLRPDSERYERLFGGSQALPA